MKNTGAGEDNARVTSSFSKWEKVRPSHSSRLAASHVCIDDYCNDVSSLQILFLLIERLVENNSDGTTLLRRSLYLMSL